MRTVTAFFCATTNGEFPTVPKKTLRACERQLPNCQQYRPDKVWKVFEVWQSAPSFGQKMPYTALRIENADPDVSGRLLEQLYLRHADALSRLGFNTEVMRRPDEISA